MNKERRCASSVQTQGGLSAQLIESIRRLDGWINRNGWAGYDPYDIRGHPLILRLLSTQGNAPIVKLGKRVAVRGFGVLPLASRKLLGVERQINAKAMGLFASAHLRLHQTLKDERTISVRHRTASSG